MMENKESLEAISLSCRKILKLLSGFLLLQKDQQKGKDRRVSAILNLMYRMTCNILTVLMMSNWSQKRNNTVFLKLPMGVLLRTVLTDSLHAMFFTSISDTEVEKELELLRMGYANSLLERREVYKDKVNTTGNWRTTTWISMITTRRKAIGLRSWINTGGKNVD